MLHIFLGGGRVRLYSLQGIIDRSSVFQLQEWKILLSVRRSLPSQMTSSTRRRGRKEKRL